MDAKRARLIAKVLEKYPDRLLILDDHWGPISEGPLCLLPPKRGRWLFVRSVSKFLGPDYRLAVTLGDELTICRIQRQHALGPRWVSRVIQRMVFVLWASRSTDALIKKARESYAARRKGIIAELGKNGIAASGNSGIHIWVPVARESDVVQAMLGFGWAIQAGEPFRLESPPAVRIGVANLQLNELAIVARDLSQSLSSRRRFVS